MNSEINLFEPRIDVNFDFNPVSEEKLPEEYFYNLSKLKPFEVVSFSNHNLAMNIFSQESGKHLG